MLKKMTWPFESLATAPTPAMTEEIERLTISLANTDNTISIAIYILIIRQ